MREVYSILLHIHGVIHIPIKGFAIEGYSLTCRVLSGHGAPIERRAILSDGPNLMNATYGNRLERLVCSHM